jgi:hypothetical protein
MSQQSTVTNLGPNRKTRRAWLHDAKLHGDMCRKTRGAKAYLRGLNLACNKGRLTRAN